MDRDVKRLKRSCISLAKVQWNSKRGPEFTWEREDQFKKKYPHLFNKTAPSSSAASYEYIKNHKKTVKKNRQAWTRERKSKQKPEAMVKPQSNCSQKVKP
ncbi:hypothetical protein Tco_1418509 [Tanacetum coccineum]